MRNNRRRHSRKRPVRACLAQTPGGYVITTPGPSRLQVLEKIFFFDMGNKEDLANARSAKTFLDAGRIRKKEAKRLLISLQK